MHRSAACAPRSTEIDVAGQRVRAGTWTRRRSPGPATTSSSSPPAPGRSAPAARDRRARSARRADPGRRPGAHGHARPDAGRPGGRRRRGLHRRGDGRGADQARLRGHRRCNRGAQPMSTLDPDMGGLVHDAMDGLGITGRRRRGHRDPHRRRTAGSARWSPTDAEYPADVVVLGIGVEPGDGPGRARPDCRSGPHGGLLTDLSMRVRGPREHLGGRGLRRGPGPGRPAARGTSLWAPTPTSTARSSAPTSAAATRTFPGVVGTAVSKVVRPGDRPDRTAGEGRPRGRACGS